MKNSNFVFHSVLLMSMVVPAAMAENPSTAEQAQQPGMSTEEHANFREKMRLRMEQTNINKIESNQNDTINAPEQNSMQKHDSRYGQGYQARQRLEDKPESGADNRVERPRFERPNRGDMMRR